MYKRQEVMLMPSFWAALPAMTPPRRIFADCRSDRFVMGTVERRPDSEPLMTLSLIHI